MTNPLKSSVKKLNRYKFFKISRPRYSYYPKHRTPFHINTCPNIRLVQVLSDGIPRESVWGMARDSPRIRAHFKANHARDDTFGAPILSLLCVTPNNSNNNNSTRTHIVVLNSISPLETPPNYMHPRSAIISRLYFAAAHVPVLYIPRALLGLQCIDIHIYKRALFAFASLYTISISCRSGGILHPPPGIKAAEFCIALSTILECARASAYIISIASLLYRAFQQFRKYFRVGPLARATKMTEKDGAREKNAKRREIRVRAVRA